MHSPKMTASVRLLGHDETSTSVDTTGRRRWKKVAFWMGLAVMVICLVAAAGSGNKNEDVALPLMAVEKSGNLEEKPNTTRAPVRSDQATVGTPGTGTEGYVWIPHTGNGCGSTCTRYDTTYRAVTSGVYGYGGHRFYVCAVNDLASGWNNVAGGVNYCKYRDADAVQIQRLAIGTFQCLCREPTRQAEMWVSNRALDGDCAQVCNMQGKSAISPLFGDKVNICMTCLNWNDCRSGNNGQAQSAKNPCSVADFGFHFSSMSCLCG